VTYKLQNTVLQNDSVTYAGCCKSRGSYDKAVQLATLSRGGLPVLGGRVMHDDLCIYIQCSKMDLLEIGVNVVDWIGLARDRYRWRALVNSVMNLRVP
jgi:hypothetical protein